MRAKGPKTRYAYAQLAVAASFRLRYARRLYRPSTGDTHPQFTVAVFTVAALATCTVASATG
jgi:hypothetical protein